MSFIDSKINIDLSKDKGIIGVTDDFFALYINKLLKQENRDILIVTNTLYEANKLYNAISCCINNSFLFPMDDFLASEAIAISPDFLVSRLDTINQTYNVQNKVIITNLTGYLRFLPSKSDYKKHIMNIKINQEIGPKALVNKFTDMGYIRETIVNSTGELGVRGFVIDIFPINETKPVRFEFFGDTIESIRYFDDETQKSLEEITEITIYPYSEMLIDNEAAIFHKDYSLYYDNPVNIEKYLNDPITIYKDYNQIKTAYVNMLGEINEYKALKDVAFVGEYMHSLEVVVSNDPFHYLSVDNISDDINGNGFVSYDVKEAPKFNENIKAINKYISDSLYDGFTVILSLKDYQIKNFTKHLASDFIITGLDTIYENKLNIIDESFNKGFIFKKNIVLTPFELFIEVREKKYKSSYKQGKKLTDLSKIEIGDYVVHNIHGIGQYNGIKTLNQGIYIKDYLEVLYAKGDKLYIPVEKIDILHKFTGKEGVAPKIHSLGGDEWQKTKQRVKNKVKDIVDKLLKLYAERELARGFAFAKDGVLQQQFESDFNYELTRDQKSSLIQIKSDMEAIQPMDRLLCGDVGYGKTEVAFCAIMKAVASSKQVLYLCPTTILSNQHYQNALIRFKNIPINIAILNRFSTTKEVKKIIDGLKEGTIDVVFGTHRLLSSDIKPKDLGLLIIDEEQRFGVLHKEKLKDYKKNVDVLTLTATPIPRTLQMSMVGIRSLSLIETPPVDRHPVHTYVIEENPQIIKDAVYKELSRDGQAFILYNRVEFIENKRDELQSLLPDAKIIVAHGKLTKQQLEDVMLKFINHEYDVMLCSTIIETGIDIPNANTLIILEAEKFGLSQLYQIRGRVGRSSRLAYSYLMYSKNKVLTDTAIKRLDAIKKFTELGSGFSIATRDLSIRGAGDILGSEQAGFIDSIGIDLYLKILNEEVERLKGNIPKEEAIENTKPLITVNTHIDDAYVEENDLKIEIHSMINKIDCYDKLMEVKLELEDRFGKFDDDILLYMHEEWFEKLVKKLNIIEVKNSKNSITLIFNKEMTDSIDTEKLFLSAYEVTNMFRFQLVGSCLGLVLDILHLDKHPLYYFIELLEKVELKIG